MTWDTGERWWVVGGLALAFWSGRSWRKHEDADVAVLGREVPSMGEPPPAALGCGLPFEIVPTASTQEHWISRRDPKLKVEWSRAVVEAMGVPVLAPELILLGKAHAPRPRDEVDARQIAPMLRGYARAFLSNRLGDAHGWQMLLSRSDDSVPGSREWRGRG